MSSDETVGTALDRVVATIRGQIETELRAYTDELTRGFAAQAQIESLRDSARRESEELRHSAESQIAEWKRTLDDLRRVHQQELDAVRRTADAEIEDARRMALAHVEDVQRTFNERTLTTITRVVDAAAAMDAASSLGDVLTALAEFAAREADRAALVIVRGDRLQTWRTSGFPDAPAADWQRLTPMQLLNAELPAGVDGGARQACTFPVEVGGTPVAILYADVPDESPRAGDRTWHAVLDLVARHAGRALQAMTIRQLAGVRTHPSAVARASHSSVVNRAMPSGVDAGLEH